VTTTNLALYRVLVKLGAPDTEAEDAATLDPSALATKADLAELRSATKADLAELKAELTKTMVTIMIAMTAIFAGISAALRFVK
jgi:hypothetical protein